MGNKLLLISGRSEFGKINLMIHYANQYTETTLVLSEESTEEKLPKKAIERH